MSGSLKTCAIIKIITDYNQLNIQTPVKEKIAFMAPFVPQLYKLLNDIFKYSDKELDVEYYKRYSEFVKTESIKCSKYIQKLKKKEINETMKKFKLNPEQKKQVNSIIKAYMDGVEIKNKVDMLEGVPKNLKRRDALTPIQAVILKRMFPIQIPADYIKRISNAETIGNNDEFP